MCGKEFAIDHSIKSADYLSGACFGRMYSSTAQSHSTNTAGSSKPFVAPSRYSNLSDSTNKPSSTTQRRAIPLVPVDLISANPTNQSKPSSAQIKSSKSHWTANWYNFTSDYYKCARVRLFSRRKAQTRKHKTWDGDAFVSQVGNKLIMISEEGKM